MNNTTHSQTQPLAAGFHAANGHAHRHTALLSASQPATVELLRYWNLLWGRRYLIAGLTLLVALAVGSYTRFFVTKLYRAEATVTPTAPGDGGDELGLSSLSGGMGGGGIGALLGLSASGATVVTAERYLAMMQSYDFGVALARQYNLAPELLGAAAATATPWALHKRMNERFSSEYDYKSGNLTFYFIDPNPERAKRILGLYLGSLRDKLRSEAVGTAQAAVLSLQDEIKQTPDALLQNQLYELMAHQIQREKLAEVQANFAYKLVEPPVVPDHYFAPSARAKATLDGFIVFFALCAYIIAREWIAAAQSEMAANDASPYQPAPAPFVLEHPEPAQPAAIHGTGEVAAY